MSETAQTKVSFSRRLRAHLAIARLDHSIKNLFVLPGIIVPLSIYPKLLTWRLGLTLVWAFVAITLVACSNYVLNEVLDAPFDRLHPTKKDRPGCAWVGEHTAGLRAVDFNDGGGRGDWMDDLASVCDYSAGAVGHGLRVQHPAAAHQGRALSGCADRERKQSAAHVAGMVRGGGVAGASAEPADVLLDDRLLLHGAEALQRVARSWARAAWRGSTARASSTIPRSRCW